VRERANTQPSGSAPSAAGSRVGTRRLRELLAVRGEAGLWLAEDDGGGEALLRLYPGLPTLAEWHKLALTARELLDVVDARLVPLKEIALDVWPCLTFACSNAEPLSRRIAREPMTPAAAVAMCADVTGALAALARAGMPPVDVGPADVVLVGEHARLLADVGLASGAQACVELDYLAPERAAAIARSGDGAAIARDAAPPTAASTTYALASIVTAAIHGPALAGVGRDHATAGAGDPPTALPARLEQALSRGLAPSPSERYETPAALVEALGDAIGIRLPQPDASTPHVPRATRAHGGRATVARRRTRPGRRRARIALPIAAALAAAAIGTVVGSATTPPDAPAAVTLAGAGLSVEAPQGWLRARTGHVPPVLGAPAIVARSPAHPPGSSAAALVISRTAAPLLAQLADDVPEAVRLGRQEAWHYRGVALDAAGVADVYVVEYGDGSIVAACLGPSGASPLSRQRCAAALTTLRIHAGRAAALGGDAAARRGLAHVVDELDRARASERRALATAATARRQAAAADRLAAAYAHAADGARRAGTVGAPGALARLVARLQETGRTYAELATAARGTHRTAYTSARERVVAHEHALTEELAALGSATSGS
jgi:serine/threonine-protein kinase